MPWWKDWPSTKKIRTVMPRQPPPVTFTSCPGLTSVGETTNVLVVVLAGLGLLAQAGAASAPRAMATLSATNAADILRMRSSLGETAGQGWPYAWTGEGSPGTDRGGRARRADPTGAGLTRQAG